MKFFKREKAATPVKISDGIKPVYQPSASLSGRTASSEDISVSYTHLTLPTTPYV